MNTRKLMVATVMASSFVLTACGGGGGGASTGSGSTGGGTGGGASSLSYTGSTQRALITAENTEEFYDVLVDIGIDSVASGDNAIENRNMTVSLNRAATNVRQSCSGDGYVLELISSGSTSETRKETYTDYDGTENCGEEKLNGVVVTSTSGNNTTVELDQFSVTRSNFESIIAGYINIAEQSASQYSMTYNTVYQENDGGVTKFEDLVISISKANADAGETIAINGRVYLPELGYVDIETVETLEKDADSQSFKDGVVEYLGESSKTRVTYGLFNSVTFETDVDGDGIFDITKSCYQTPFGSSCNS